MFFKALLFAAVALAQVPVPPLKARVTDLTGTLDQQQRSALEQTLGEFEARKGSQIAVLLVPTTKPETPVEYGVRVFDAWKLGRKGIDDGVLLLVAKDDRRVWIVTGRGVEGVLPDAIVRRIVEEDITPRFKQGDFYGGIRAGADRMMRLIEGEKFPAPRAGPQALHSVDTSTLFMAFIFVLVLGGILRAVFGRLIGAGVIGSITAVAAWVILSSLAIGAIAGVVAFLITLMNSGRGSGGWSSGGGGFSSGGGGFSSGGGGGFSGGGGSTSGGGAGGSW
ncbi:MAG: uncharacterized protein QOD26_1130 [Betaproteobacteria bacterium]|nr:uncharacterized protein [Betaproteobacteria bacterium]